MGEIKLVKFMANISGVSREVTYTVYNVDGEFIPVVHSRDLGISRAELYDICMQAEEHLKANPVSTEGDPF